MSRMQYSDYIENPGDRKTKDDTFTPDWVYEAVSQFVTRQYGISRDRFVRPFYPGGDYQHFDYHPDDVVVDNPPFSIGSKIRDFFHEHGISFFLFCPAVVTRPKHGESMVFIKGSIVYDNGLDVRTAFITNLERNTIRTDARLSSQLKKRPKPKTRKHAPAKYIPGSIVTTKFWQTGDTDQCIRYEKVATKGAYGQNVMQTQYIPVGNDYNKEDD